MENRKVKIILLAFGTLLLILGIPYVVFYFAFGSENMPGWDLWFPLILFFTFFGTVTLTFRLVSGISLTSAEEHISYWKDTRARGKWKYIFTLFAQISLLTLIPLTFIFFISSNDESSDSSQLHTAYLALFIITLIGAFIVSLKLWKRNEDRFLRDRLR